jgi:hypothetical protein
VAGASFMQEMLSKPICEGVPNCSFENTMWLLGQMRKNIEKGRYDTVYGMCIRAKTEKDFYLEIQRFNEVEKYCNSIFSDSSSRSKCYEERL